MESCRGAIRYYRASVRYECAGDGDKGTIAVVGKGVMSDVTVDAEYMHNKVNDV